MIYTAATVDPSLAMVRCGWDLGQPTYPREAGHFLSLQWIRACENDAFLARHGLGTPHSGEGHLEANQTLDKLP